MTKLPEEETTTTADTNMEGEADNKTNGTEQVIQNGDLIHEDKESKHDDFFDDAPIKQSLHEEGTTEEENKLTNGDVGGENVQQTEEEGGVKDEEPEQSEQTVEGEAEVKTEETGEQTEVAPEAESGSAEQTDEKEEEQDGGERDEPEKPEADTGDAVQRPETADTNEEVTQEPQEEADAEKVAAPDSLEVADSEERRVPSGQSDYDEDFSQVSEHTDAGAGAAAEAGEVEGEEEVAATPATTEDGAEDEQQKEETEETGCERCVDGETRSRSVSSCAGVTSFALFSDQQKTDEDHQNGDDPPQAGEEEELINPDSRAEAAAVVPVVMEEDNAKTTDDRSSVGPDDQGEFNRGEDRTEEPAPEGSEDCRGQGQWKSEEQQAIASAMIVHKSEKEALQEAVMERDRIRTEYDELKARLATLEEEANRSSDEVVVNKEILSRKEKEIADLQKEVELLRASNADGETAEMREKDQLVIKDLQERLAILARENEEKDKRIFKLETDLKDMTAKLRETERKLFATEASANQREAPKSKTCVIM